MRDAESCVIEWMVYEQCVNDVHKSYLYAVIKTPHCFMFMVQLCYSYIYM